ncbi:MAG: CD1871A family CXXC motif-containing protein [Anaerovoracaceae bacterium]
MKYFKYVLLAVGMVFVLYGVARGEANEVLNKAIRICLECIGVG